MILKGTFKKQSKRENAVNVYTFLKFLRPIRKQQNHHEYTKYTFVIFDCKSQWISAFSSVFVQVDFFIDDKMVHIADTRVGSRYGEQFIRKISKFIEMEKIINTQ